MQEEKYKIRSAMGKSYPKVSEEYLKAVEKCRRKLRGVIAEKQCAPIVVRMAYDDASIFLINYLLLYMFFNDWR